MACAAEPLSATDPLDTILFASPVVRIGKFRVRPGHPRFRDSGPIQRHIVVFPRDLVRIAHAGQDGFLAGPDLVTYYNRGQLYRRESLEGRPDRCEWFAFGWSVLAEALSRLEPAARDRPDAPFPFPHGPGDPGSYFRQRRIVNALTCGPGADPSEVEEESLGILARLLRAAYACGARVRLERACSRALRRDRELAESAKTVIARLFRGRVTLELIASGLGVSIFRLCRVFRRQTGTTLHGYLSRLRLAASLEHLQYRSVDLADVGLSLGYSSHSHFTASFRREFGVPPSAFRDTPGNPCRSSRAAAVSSRGASRFPIKTVESGP